MLDFATRFLTIAVTNYQSFAYQFVGNIGELFDDFDDFACVKRYNCCKPTWVLDA